MTRMDITMTFWLNIIKFFMLFNLMAKVICLKDLKISVPEAVAAGDTVTLSCFYDLENAALYSIRWYIDQEEFYRYIPKETPPARVFEIKGLSVDLKRSTENSVILRSVSRNQSGNYQCEVSADAPLFHTESNSATMLVAKLPESEPIITIYGMPGVDNKRIVTFGETFKASCVSGPSYPSVNFTWLINDIKFPSTHSGLRNIESMGNDIDSKEAWSELVVHVDNHIIIPGHSRRLIIRCETNIYSLYKGAAEAELNVIEDNYWTYGGIGGGGGSIGGGGGNNNGGKVSPTIDQRGNRGDPDNSALTGNSVQLNDSICFSFIVKFFLVFIFIVNLLQDT